MVDERIKRAADADRQERAMEQRQAIGGDRDIPLDDDDEIRFQMYRDTFSRVALPNLPEMDGFHVCWLTTTNNRDSVASRMAIGYELLTEALCPGFGHLRAKDGEMAGCISVNEMVAARIPLRLYERFMMESHHNAPLEEETKLEDQIRQLQHNASAQKGRIVPEQDSLHIRQMARRPSFTS